VKLRSSIYTSLCIEEKPTPGRSHEPECYLNCRKAGAMSKSLLPLISAERPEVSSASAVTRGNERGSYATRSSIIDGKRSVANKQRT
jgi:hypothetical protein